MDLLTCIRFYMLCIVYNAASEICTESRMMKSAIGEGLVLNPTYLGE